MSALRVLASRIASLFRRRRLEAEMEEELAFHLEELTAENLRRGMDPAEARRRARIRLGGPEQIKEAVRERRGLPGLEILLRDLRHAARRLVREPGFTTVVVLTMALGIGANTAVFSLIRGVVLRPLPYPEPERLVRVFADHPSYPDSPVSPLDFLDYRREAEALSGLAAYTREDLELSSPEQPERLAALRVTPSYFEVLGVRPALGRSFRDGETRDAPRVVIFSDALWHRRFGADPDIVGGTVRLDGEAWRVVGVMPPGFEHVGGSYRSPAQGETVDVWWPLELHPDRVRRNRHYLNAVGRLAPGATPAVAEGELDAVAADLEARHPESNTDWRVTVRSLHREVSGAHTTLLLVLMAAVGFVLLIACANVASLLLARSGVRRHEIAVRSAIGASRGRLTQQVLAESAVLAAVGALAGLVVAVVSVPALVALMPADFPRLHAIRVDAQVLAFTGILAVATAVAFGLAPALRSGRTDPSAALSESGSRVGAARGAVRARSILVVAEVALATALLVGAGLLLRSFVTLQQTAPGFEPSGLLTLSLSLPEARYPEWSDAAALVRRLTERLEAVPEVESAGAASYLPWSGWDEIIEFEIVDDPVERRGSPYARFGAATPGYFRALGVPLLAGRPLLPTDTDEGPPVVVVNRELADRYFPGGRAIGRRLWLGGEAAEIVGIVGDVQDAPGAPGAEPAFYWPHAQRAYRTVSLAVRTAGEPEGLVPAVRKGAAELDPTLALSDLRTGEELAEAAYAERRFLLILVLLFATVAVALAGVGTYGVLAYAVEQRRREVGLRIALGAAPSVVVRQVVGRGLLLTASGLVLGLAIASALGGLLSGLLYEVAPTDPTTLAGAGTVAFVTGALAGYLPAARAARVDPVAALRVE